MFTQSMTTTVRENYADFLEEVSDLGLFVVYHSAAIINAIATAEFSFMLIV